MADNKYTPEKEIILKLRPSPSRRDDVPKISQPFTLSYEVRPDLVYKAYGAYYPRRFQFTTEVKNSKGFPFMLPRSVVTAAGLRDYLLNTPPQNILAAKQVEPHVEIETIAPHGPGYGVSLEDDWRKLKETPEDQLGEAATRKGIRKMQSVFPDMEYVKGSRVTGVHGGEWGNEQQIIPIPGSPFSRKLKEERRAKRERTSRPRRRLLP